MEIKSFIIALGSLILTGISIYFAYKARTAPYREVLYSKQIEAYVEIANAVTDASEKVFNFINTGGLKTEEGPERCSQALDGILNLDLKQLKWLVLSQREIALSLKNFNEECVRILYLPFNKENKNLLRDAQMKILNEIRNAIGTESLSGETFRLIEKIKS